MEKFPNMRRSMIFAAVAATALGTAALAADPKESPEDRALDYLETRLEDPRGARLEVRSDPYRVVFTDADGTTREGVAIDVAYRTRDRGRIYRSDDAVILVDGEAVALESDMRRLTKA